MWYTHYRSKSLRERKYPADWKFSVSQGLLCTVRYTLRDRKFQRAKVPGSEKAWEQKGWEVNGQGGKGLGRKSARERIGRGPIRRFAAGSLAVYGYSPAQPLSKWIRRTCVRIHLCKITTRSSAIAERPRCSLFKLWQNISAKSVHLTLLYVTALTSTNHHFTVLRHHVCT